MTASAIFVMILGMVLIWGGLTASITYAVKKSRQK
ncbi:MULTISPECIES: methionine/alanine import family NSS transporter small subunit [Clostridia]|nr:MULTISPECIES: methionine/alanine import family NSS transporter small subunit [Clostridia]NBJ69244.1 methionine/alanine import family NSS transporter small subunit [Roseburia sp. 1XD42-34]RKI79213.1 methionine/alanine import family NSS transporter small subunit [Clostridium sp. 1xD42-85]